MGNFSTNMKTLLTTIKDSLKADSDFAAINTWKRGVMPPEPAFDAISVVPLRERKIEHFAGRMYHVARDVVLNIFVKSLNPKEALEDAMDWIEKMKEHVQANFQWSETAMDTRMGAEQFGEPESWTKAAMVQPAALPLTVISKEWLYANDTTTTISEGSARSLGDYIHTTLKASALLTDISQSAFYWKVIPPIPRLPALCLVENTEAFMRTWAGADEPIRAFVITVWEKLLARETMLDNILDAVENVKDVVQGNHTWGGRCIYSDIVEVIFGEYVTEEVALYSASLQMICHSREVL